MKKTIITISRQFGSGGRTIGHAIANKLGIPFYDKELVDQISLESGFAPNWAIVSLNRRLPSLRDWKNA